ncbi:hypothetical protein MRX96_013486 [Rhipicephalus microplus]
MKAYFALCVLMSKVKKSSIQSYWSTRPVTSTSFFATVMSRHRFWALSRYLHFCNNSLPRSEDRLWNIQPVLDIILKSIGAAYNPEASVAVDESLMKFRGRLYYVQFNPSKRARFGVKFYKLSRERGSSSRRDFVVESSSRRDYALWDKLSNKKDRYVDDSDDE